MSENTEPLLSMRGIEKRFPGVVALQGFDFELRAGEVHALMGQNGAGKSTLIRVLTGVHTADAGTITVAGQPFRATSPADARRKGIGVVYQEFNLIPALSVAENLALGGFSRRWFGIDWRSCRRRAADLLKRFDLKIDVRASVGELPSAVQQIVSIVRAMQFEPRVLILDEPTSSLDADEVQRLFTVVRQLRRDGMGLIFIAHSLDEIYDISDRVTILRNGTRIGTYPINEITRADAVSKMLGRDEDAEQLPATRGVAAPDAAARIVIRTHQLGRKGSIEPFNLTCREGEIVGLAGLLGSGRTEAARLLFGADRADTGNVDIGSQSQTPRSPRHAVALGLAFCPEDRRADAIFPDMSVMDNIALVIQRRLNRFGFLNPRRSAELAARLVERLGVKTAGLHVPIRTLSGGNQQKAILARWLACDPRLLILDDPVRGMDVGAKQQLMRIVEALRAERKAILLISSELREMIDHCDRIEVLRDRKFVGALEGRQINETSVMQLMSEHTPAA